MLELYNFSLILIFSFALLAFILLFFISAPYGKFLREGWGPVIKSKWAWMLMEFPSPVFIIFLFFTSPGKGPVKYIFVLMWIMHYLHRTFIYPFTQSGRNKDYPLIIAGMAFIFNCFNGFINGYGVFRLKSYDTSYLRSWPFMAGVVLFITGFVINKIADEKLRRLRNNSPDRYVLPEGWLFRYISSPHYFGEIIEWGGWAVATWSLPGLVFFVFTFANLFPRAVSSHKWYRDNFPDYPADRNAVIPFII